MVSFLRNQVQDISMLVVFDPNIGNKFTDYTLCKA